MRPAAGYKWHFGDQQLRHVAWKATPAPAVQLSTRGLTPAQKAALDELDLIISSVSGPAHPEVWADEALEDREEWRLIRKAAQDLIQATG